MERKGIKGRQRKRKKRRKKEKKKKRKKEKKEGEKDGGYPPGCMIGITVGAGWDSRVSCFNGETRIPLSYGI